MQSSNRDTDIENKFLIPREERGWDKLGDWDCHIYTIDTMHKITENLRTYCVTQGTLLNALW